MNTPPPPVSSLPTLPPLALLAMRRRPLPPPLDRPGTSFWFSARVALWQATRALGLKAGDAVAVPAFCCGSELESFVQAGLRLHVFGVTARLDPDPVSFRRALEGASAALVTHYFGFPADLGDALAACRERGVPLIEDCAHALYATSGSEPLGTAGAAAVYSLWKTLPLPDGGALVLRHDVGSVPEPASPPPRAEVERRTRHLIAQHMLSDPTKAVRLAFATGRAARRALQLPGSEVEGVADSERVRFRPELRRASMSARSRRLLAAADHEGIRRRRRQNYEALRRGIAGLPGIRLLYPELSNGACPLFLPVFVRETPSFRRALAAKRVAARYMWPWFHPLVPWDRFPHEAELKRGTMALPVHQSLRPEEMDRVIDAIREWAGA